MLTDTEGFGSIASGSFLNLFQNNVRSAVLHQGEMRTAFRSSQGQFFFVSLFFVSIVTFLFDGLRYSVSHLEFADGDSKSYLIVSNFPEGRVSPSTAFKPNLKLRSRP
jgi:hypothetical protein